MIKKILSVLLCLLSVVFLGVGIIYSACPVIPFAKYTLYDENGELDFIRLSKDFNDKSSGFFILVSSYAIFTPNSEITIYSKYENRKRVDGGGSQHLNYGTALVRIGFYVGEDEDLFCSCATIDSEYNVRDSMFEISNSKKTLTAKDGSYLEANFNPTFIFYLVSVFSLAGLIGINYKWILKKNKKLKPEENE